MVAESSKISMEKTSEDMTDVMWSDPQWLASFPLNKSTAFHYFQMSQFYDPRCNNHLVSMQNMDPKLLKTMEGIEYSHSSPCPGLYIITKMYRKPPDVLETLAYYYIHEGRIFQAPTIYSVLSARLLQSFHHLRKSLDVLKSSVTLSTEGKYVWDDQSNSNKTGKNVDDGADDQSGTADGAVTFTDVVGGAGTDAGNLNELSSGEHKAIDDILYDIWQKNAAINEQQMERQQKLHQAQQQQQQPQQPQTQQQPSQQPQQQPQQQQTQTLSAQTVQPSGGPGGVRMM